ncbi:hypothetical protein BC834DRAFT_1043456 [Gloeopeniophorella convolvens]|nr:hypothetical protein BC834DRAFT_1043456 [Gloeopeniophorella convolvens]
MFQTIFAIASGFLYLGNILHELTRGVLALTQRRLHSRFQPTLSPSPPARLIEAPTATWEPLQAARTPPPSSGLIVIESPSPVLSPVFPIHQSSLIAVSHSSLPDLVPFLLLLVFISVSISVLPDFISACKIIFRTTLNFIPAPGFLIKLLNLPRSLYKFAPSNLFSQEFSIRRAVLLVSLALVWTGPPFIASASAAVTLVLFVRGLRTWEWCSPVMNRILLCLGLVEQIDPRTPDVLNTTFEHIESRAYTHSDLSWHRDQLRRSDVQKRTITDLCLAYSQLEVQLEDHERELQQAQAQKEDQEREARTQKLEAEKHRLRVQHIYAEFVESQNTLRTQLEVSRAREEGYKTDLLAAEKEQIRLRSIVASLEGSKKEERLQWEGVVKLAEARSKKAEKAATRLHADFAAAVNSAREAQDQWDDQIQLASENHAAVQSALAKDLQVVRNQLRDAVDHNVRLDVELQSERDRRLRKTQELLDEQARVQDLHEAEKLHLAREAEDAQEQLRALYDMLSQLSAERTPVLDGTSLHPTILPSVEPSSFDDTGQPPPPPKPSHHIGDTALHRVTTASSPPLPKFTHPSPKRGGMLYSPRPAPDLRALTACINGISDAAQVQQAAMDALQEQITQLNLERAQEKELREEAEERLHEELAVTMEKLCAMHDEVARARRDLSQEQAERQQVETRAEDLMCELSTCRAELKEVQDARRTGRIKLVEVNGLLSLIRADLESQKVAGEALEFKCSQAALFSAALRERVIELEAEVETLACKKKRTDLSASPSREPTASIAPRTHLAFSKIHLADTVTKYNTDAQSQHSTYLHASPSLPQLLDLPLPRPSSSSNINHHLHDDQPHIAPYSSQPGFRIDLSEHPDLSLAHHLPPSPSDASSSSTPHPAVSLPVEESVCSMDWPPIERMRFSAGGDTNGGDQNDGINALSRGGTGFPVLDSQQGPSRPPEDPNSTLPSFHTIPFSQSLVEMLLSKPQERGPSSLDYLGFLAMDKASDFHRVSEFRAPVQLQPSTRPDHVPGAQSTCSPMHTAFPSWRLQQIHAYPSDPGEVPPASLDECDGDIDVPAWVPPGTALTCERDTSLSCVSSACETDPWELETQGTAFACSLAREERRYWLADQQDGVQSGDVFGVSQARRLPTPPMLLSELSLNPHKTGSRTLERPDIQQPEELGSLRGTRLDRSHPSPCPNFGATLTQDRHAPVESGPPEVDDALPGRAPPESPPPAGTSAGPGGIAPTQDHRSPCAPQPSDIFTPMLDHQDAQSGSLLHPASQSCAQSAGRSYGALEASSLPTGSKRHSTGSRPKEPLPRLLPGFFEPMTARKATFVEDEDSPSVVGGPGAIRPRDALYRMRAVRPRDIPKLDYGLSEDFVPDPGHMSSNATAGRLAHSDEFAFIIPLDCATSTPRASRIRAVNRLSPAPDEPSIHLPPPPPRAQSMRVPLTSVSNRPQPRSKLVLSDLRASKKGKGRARTYPTPQPPKYPPDPIFDFFGI